MDSATSPGLISPLRPSSGPASPLRVRHSSPSRHTCHLLLCTPSSPTNAREFARISGLLETPSDEVTPDERPFVDELLRIRGEFGTPKGDDLGSLQEQYHAQVSLLEQLRSSRGRPQVDPANPYFAHMRLREEIDGELRERDLCLGKANRIERGMRIVDWRHAPVSKLFYQYRQGDTYEEEMGGRVAAWSRTRS